ncbi:MAG: hypothetical protein IPO94_05150 [Saprospiraceae bacterium]|nr:hypothetical protein [Saprospiraceae bacterium]
MEPNYLLTMTYDKDTGNNDEYKKDIGPNLTQGYWGIYLLLKCGRLSRFYVGRYMNAQLTVNAPLPIKLSDFYGKENSNIIEPFLGYIIRSQTMIISKFKLEVMVQILFH